MVKKIITKLAVARKTGRSNESVYRSPRIYLPIKLTDDSSFPFKEGDILSVRVDGRKLVIQRVQKAMPNSGSHRAKTEVVKRQGYPVQKRRILQC